MYSKILLNDITIKGLLPKEKQQSSVRTPATDDILLKEHDTRLLTFKTNKQTKNQANNFLFGNRNEDLLNFSSDRKLRLYHTSQKRPIQIKASVLCAV